MRGGEAGTRCRLAVYNGERQDKTCGTREGQMYPSRFIHKQVQTTPSIHSQGQGMASPLQLLGRSASAAKQQQRRQQQSNEVFGAQKQTSLLAATKGNSHPHTRTHRHKHTHTHARTHTHTHAQSRHKRGTRHSNKDRGQWTDDEPPLGQCQCIASFPPRTPTPSQQALWY